MRVATFLACVPLLIASLPVQARDDDLSQWSLEELCEKKDKDRHAEAVFAEIERRGTFQPFELELIREGRIDTGTSQDVLRYIGASEAVLRCSWGPPRESEARNGEPWLVYYRPWLGQQRIKVLLRIDSSRVAAMHIGNNTTFGESGTSVFRATGDGPDGGTTVTTSSGRTINRDGSLGGDCSRTVCTENRSFPPP